MEKTLLVVENQKELLQVYKRELEAEGYEILTAENGKEAIFCLNHSEIDLIVMDLDCPNTVGLDYLKDVVNLDRNLKVVIHTVYPNFRLDFNTWAADAFVIKSPDLSSLKSTIFNLLNEHNELANSSIS